MTNFRYYGNLFIGKGESMNIQDIIKPDIVESYLENTSDLVRFINADGKFLLKGSIYNRGCLGYYHEFDEDQFAFKVVDDHLLILWVFQKEYEDGFIELSTRLLRVPYTDWRIGKLDKLVKYEKLVRFNKSETNCIPMKYGKEFTHLMIGILLTNGFLSDWHRDLHYLLDLNKTMLDKLPKIC